MSFHNGKAIFGYKSTLCAIIKHYGLMMLEQFFNAAIANAFR